MSRERRWRPQDDKPAAGTAAVMRRVWRATDGGVGDDMHGEDLLP